MRLRLRLTRSVVSYGEDDNGGSDPNEVQVAAYTSFVLIYPSHSGFQFLQCVARAPGQGIATSNSEPYCEKR